MPLSGVVIISELGDIYHVHESSQRPLLLSRFAGNGQQARWQEGIRVSNDRLRSIDVARSDLLERRRR
jgi:hypothetical protein